MFQTKKHCNLLSIFKSNQFMNKTCLKSVCFFTLLCVILIIDGCVKDNCKTVVCLHNGVCMDGTCSCPDGYSGANCETCSRVCQNGYLENDCTCHCPLAYSGANCETQLSKLVLYDSIGTQKEVFYYIKGDTLTLKSDYYLITELELSLFFRSPNCTGNCFWAKGTYPEENLGNTITFVGVDSVYYINQWFSQIVGIGGESPYFRFNRHSWKGVIR